jgi:hypothetical protein
LLDLAARKLFEEVEFIIERQRPKRWTGSNCPFGKLTLYSFLPFNRLPSESTS